MSHPHSLPALLAVCLATGCASPPPEPVAGHTHRVTTMVTVTDASVLPSPHLEIPAFSSVLWRNRGSQPLEITIEAKSCGTCETVLGFQPAGDCARSVPIAPGSLASICFHEVGRFPFVAKIGEHEQRGEIVVGEAQ